MANLTKIYIYNHHSSRHKPINHHNGKKKQFQWLEKFMVLWLQFANKIMKIVVVEFLASEPRILKQEIWYLRYHVERKDIHRMWPSIRLFIFAFWVSCCAFLWRRLDSTCVMENFSNDKSWKALIYTVRNIFMWNIGKARHGKNNRISFAETEKNLFFL